MAFTFTVEDGTGLAAATSYVSETEADDYLIQNIQVFDTWDALTTTQKEYVLSWASRYLDQHAHWYGTKYVETSGLRWPREGVCDIDGFEIDNDVIPEQLKQATIELASYLMIEDISRSREQDGLERLRVDVIELYFNKDYRLPSIPNELKLIIKGLGYLKGGVGGSGRILRA